MFKVNIPFVGSYADQVKISVTDLWGYGRGCEEGRKLAILLYMKGTSDFWGGLKDEMALIAKMAEEDPFPGNRFETHFNKIFGKEGGAE